MPVNPESVIYKEINEFTLKPLIDGLEKIQITREFATTLKAISDFVNNYYNVTHLHPLGSGYYTSTTARAAIPTNVKRRGLVITFETSDGVWSKEQFLGNPATEWATAGKWKTLPGDTLQDVGTSTIDTLSQNVISTFFDRQVKDYNSSYVFKGFCVANQAAPSTPSANDVYLYTGSVTATVFGIANVPAKNYLVYSGTAWTIVNPYIPKPLSSKGTSVNDTMSQNAISNELNQLATDEAAMVPSIQFNKRVVADSGSIKDKSALFESYRTALNLLPNTVLAYSPEMGVKQSVSGLVYKASKLYDMSPFNNDANQATAANQPYIGGNIAPNERMWLWGNGKYITHTIKPFVNTEKWSFFWVGDIIYSSTVYFGVSQGGISLTLLGASFTNTLGTQISMLHSLNVLNRTTRHCLICRGLGEIEYWADGILRSKTSIADTSITFQNLYTLIKTKSVRIFNKDLSKYEIEGIDKFFANIYPEYETTNIGSQAWLTNNHLGNVTSDGFIIPEVQGNDAASNPELITNAADREFSSDTGFWTKNGTNTTFIDGVLRVTNADTSLNGINRNLLLAIGEQFQVVLTINSLSNGGVTIQMGTNVFTINTIGTFNVKGICQGDTRLRLYGNTIGQSFEIDNVSVKKCGWADSQTLYDNAITYGKSVLDASKAASMYCKYNNSDDNAAVYGYIYNYFARYLFRLFPPKGLRAPLSPDFEQTKTTIGSTDFTIYSKKLMSEKSGYFTIVGTNETGFSAVGSGIRNSDGTFNYLNSFGTIGGGDNSILHIATNSNAIGHVNTRGFALRFLKNAPVAESQNIIRTTGKFPTDIVSGAKSIQIPFGFRVTNIVITSSTNVTNIEAKLFDAAGVERTLLLTQKVCNSTSLIFQVLGDQPILLQDPTVRVTAKNNGGDGMIIDVLATQVIF